MSDLARFAGADHCAVYESTAWMTADGMLTLYEEDEVTVREEIPLPEGCQVQCMLFGRFVHVYWNDDGSQVKL